VRHLNVYPASASNLHLLLRTISRPETLFPFVTEVGRPKIATWRCDFAPAA
jgi:hypothetical protein